MRFAGFPAWFLSFLFFLLRNLFRAPVLPLAVQVSLVGEAQVVAGGQDKPSALRTAPSTLS